MRPRRKSMRLEGYDYTEEGAYFVTVVTQGREMLFGRVENGEMVLNAFGRIVEDTWKDLIRHNSGIVLEEFMVMPNHFHGVIIIDSPVGAGSQPARFWEDHGPDREGHPSRTKRSGTQKSQGPSPTGGRRSLSEIMRQFKTFSAKRINALRNTPGQPVWQRGFYDPLSQKTLGGAKTATYHPG